MMHRRVGQPAGGAIGQFAGRHEPQQTTDGTIAGDLQGSMADDPGIRLAHSRGKRTFKGGGLTLQRYADAQGAVNSPDALDALPLSAGNHSRALGQSSRLANALQSQGGEG